MLKLTTMTPFDSIVMKVGTLCVTLKNVAYPDAKVKAYRCHIIVQGHYVIRFDTHLLG